jgi:uncharacterized protein (TIGR00299 family) protein
VKTLALDPVGGIAGDMLIAALLHLGAPRAALDEGLRKLNLPVTVEAAPVSVSGIGALHVQVKAPDEDHVHRPFREIRDLLARAGLPEGATRRAQAAFALLAAAEAKIHGVPVEEVEFHEVGALDSIADVVGAALLLEALAVERIVALPPPAGAGTARTAHGLIPLPAPATLEVLRGRALRPSGPGERTTPTGAAMLAAWTEEAPALPEMSLEAVGYGAGTKRWDDAPNLLRAVLGEAASLGDEAWVLETNLDDLSPQLAAVALEAALKAGALDAWIAPVTMKKGRPGHLFGALCTGETRAAVEAVIFRETSTLGIRATPVSRTVLAREWVAVETPYGSIRVKVGRSQGRICNVQPEFDDCREAAERHQVPVKEVQAAALSAFRSP